MKGNKYIKRVRVDSRQLDSGMIGTKVYVTEGEVVKEGANKFLI
uniref:Uncharacterized protein n=1 Tax=Klebsiella pneumoniae TaxID=573 RepID=A0A5P1PNH6_KLEPN|nr:hypothetical protein [Klebsiella pneumoniae]QEQ70228.1 hypothetical protein [Klebsiella pneumoniae]